MLLVTVQALGELAVLFPVNGAFFTYVVRFVDPSLYVESFFIRYVIANVGTKWLCNWMGLRNRVAYRSSIRTYSSGYHNPVLEGGHQYRGENFRSFSAIRAILTFLHFTQLHDYIGC
jgi:hypothetical protein